MRPTAVFIDGFNLYFGLKDAKLSRWLWVDLWKLAERVAPPDHYVEDVFYYTAPLRKPADSVARQATWLAANKAQNPRLKVIEGYMEYRTRTCGSEHREEKQTDVNLAVDLVVTGAGGKYEAVVLVCGDSDQVAAVRRVQDLGVNVYGRFPPERHSNHLARVITTGDAFEMSKERVKKSLMHSPVGNPGGHPYCDPWR